MPSYCRKPKIVAEAVALGWVTWAEDTVTITKKGRRALDGHRRWIAAGHERVDVRMYG